MNSIQSYHQVDLSWEFDHEQKAKMIKASLPTLVPPQLRERPEVPGACERILYAEARAIQDEANEDVVSTKVIGSLSA